MASRCSRTTGFVNGPVRYLSDTNASTPSTSFASKRRIASVRAALSARTTSAGAGTPGGGSVSGAATVGLNAAPSIVSTVRSSTARKRPAVGRHVHSRAIRFQRTATSQRGRAQTGANGSDRSARHRLQTGRTVCVRIRHEGHTYLWSARFVRQRGERDRLGRRTSREDARIGHRSAGGARDQVSERRTAPASLAPPHAHTRPRLDLVGVAFARAHRLPRLPPPHLLASTQPRVLLPA